MNEKTFEKLEFHIVRRALADEATFSGGRQLALDCMPASSIAIAERYQQETAEGITLIEMAGPPPFGGIREMREKVRSASIGKVMDATDLLDLSSTLTASAKLKTYLRQHGPSASASLLADLGSVLGTFTDLTRRIDQSIDAEGHVVDGASAKLREIRVRLRRARSRVREQLDALVRSEKGRKMLQDTIVTVRSGRLVVPVKQEYRQHIPGLVHDRSASGSTVFIEPMFAVETNNEVTTAEREEEKEIQRILAELTSLVAAEADLIVHSCDLLAELDFIFAKSRLAIRWDAVKPKLNSDGRLNIVQGRHPLLTGKVVPIDVHLGEGDRALVVTGPNTGGKTVTIKTIGLFSIMAATGLHVPADEGSELPVLRTIHVDIGDEQSIEQNLSTFSSHMTHIIKMIADVDENTMILLDELGAGTDPTEGAALAIALLEYFIEQGALVVATTHYGELKHFAYTYPGVKNASVRFDVETLMPTFELSMGVAGESNAFAIAKRLGLPDAILRRAEKELTDSELKVEDAIRAVRADLEKAERDKEDARKLKDRYESLYEKHVEMEARFQNERARLLNEAKEEAAQIVQRARRESEELLAQLRRSQSVEDDARTVRKRFQRLTDDMRRPSDTIQSPDEVPTSTPPPEELRPGTTVTVKRLNTEGEIVEVLGDGELVVQTGAMRLTLSAKDLAVAKQNTRPKTAPARTEHGQLASWKARHIEPEIHLRGLAIDEALEALDKYLDDAVLAGIDQVRIVHGKGTGRLREAVRKFLDEDPRAKQFGYADPRGGGLGATEVTL